MVVSASEDMFVMAAAAQGIVVDSARDSTGALRVARTAVEVGIESSLLYYSNIGKADW